jgi:predicted SAM-dependent methyltransferase
MVYDARNLAEAQSVRRVLNAGSGPPSNRQLHRIFGNSDWREVRLDIDDNTTPDLVGSIVDMTTIVANGSFDAVWSSHSLEHLYAHQVPPALAEFIRVLRPDGFALITSPDLEAVASTILARGLDQAAYMSAVGPITPHDMLFGHTASLALGREFMAHKTGFTCASLGQLLANAGFAETLVKRDQWDLWALALMEDADKVAIQQSLQACGLDMFDERD